jgi:hypothetical protein
MLPFARVIVTAALGTVTAGCATHRPALGPIPVEVWRGGCCGPTLRLRDGLEDAFGASPRFVFPPGPEPARRLIVYIPDSVAFEQVGARNRLRFVVEFRIDTTDGPRIGSSTGTCWDDQIADCVALVMQDATRAARRL